MIQGDQVWVVGQTRAVINGVVDWDIQGVFASREQALSAIGERRYWLAPLMLGEMLPHERADGGWPGAEAPNGLDDEVVRAWTKAEERRR